MQVVDRYPKALVVRCVAALVALALLAVACRSDSPPDAIADDAEVVATAQVTLATPSPVAEAEPTIAATSLPEPTPEPTAAPPAVLTVLDAPFLTAISESVPVSDGAVLLASFDHEGVAATASTGTDAAGQSPTASDPFRVGSLTKVFTAMATLTLVDEGLVDLDAPAIEYVSRVPVPADITVRHLLQHRTGLFNYTEAPDVWAVLDDPTRVWTPEELDEEFVAGQPLLFEAGSRYSYSNTNYVILGVLLEEVTRQPFHEVLRQRILDPLPLSTSTYLAGFEQGPEPFDPFEYNDDAAYDYTAVATSAWAAGALVSTATDLHTFFSALFDNRLVSEALVEQATMGKQYGLGLELVDANSGLYGHAGLIPGYSTIVRHSPELGITAVVVSTDPAVPIQVPLSRMLVGLHGVPAPHG